MIESKNYELSEITSQYPHLDKWFSVPDHRTAQISQTDSTRYLSAEEKLELAGGVAQIRESLGRGVEHKTTQILAACGIQPMVAFEARRYASLLTERKSNISAGDMFPLVRRGLLDDSERIIYITRLPRNPDLVAIFDRIGFLTTDDRGLEELNRLRTHKRRVPRFVTRVRPQGI